MGVVTPNKYSLSLSLSISLSIYLSISISLSVRRTTQKGLISTKSSGLLALREY